MSMLNRLLVALLLMSPLLALAFGSSFPKAIRMRNLKMQSGDQLGIVTMYKKEGCPYCAKAKDLLEGKYGLNIKFVDIEGEKRDDILLQMRNFSGGRNTVPQIFFNSLHLGGNDDVQQLEANGFLAEKVEIVKKTPVTMMMDHWYHPWY